MAILTTTATADSGGQNDAGSGADAGNTRASAVGIVFGTHYSNNKLRAEDVDWYASAAGGSGATCVRARVTASAPTYFALGVESPGLTLSAPFFADAGRETSGGIAGIAPLTATLRTAQARSDIGLSKYNFSIERIDVPTSGGDAGSAGDAGDTSSNAMVVQPGCVGGTLAGVDLRDTFAISVPDGSVVTYSLASAGSSLTVTLVDTLGNAVGPAIAPGETASISTATPGTYYLSGVRSASFSESSYAIGVLLGPEPTGCRPYCLD